MAAAVNPLPGFREFATLLWTGQLEAAAAVLATIGAQSALSTILSLPGFDGCACIASSIYSGSRCGLDGTKLANYLADRLQGDSRDICDYR